MVRTKAGVARLLGAPEDPTRKPMVTVYGQPATVDAEANFRASVPGGKR